MGRLVGTDGDPAGYTARATAQRRPRRPVRRSNGTPGAPSATWGSEPGGPPGMSAAPPSVADPFDAGPYARLQAALNRRRLWSARQPYRAAAVTAIARVHLEVLAAVQGLAWNDRPQDSLLLDPSVCARYLVTLSVLVLA